METILFLAHTGTDTPLSNHALEALGAAQTLAGGLDGASLIVGLVGAQVDKAAGALAGAGAARILGVSGAEFAESRFASDAAAATALARESNATIVVAPGTSRWSRVLPAVSHRIDGYVDTHVTGITTANGAPAITRWYYRQRMESVLQRSQRPWVLTVDPGCFAPPSAESAGGSAALEKVAVDLPESCRRTKVVGIQAPATDEETIRPDAELLFVAGAGWTKKQADGAPHVEDAEKLILGFLRAAQCSLGGSKSLVDLGGEGHEVLKFMTHLNQVGQTGATPRHPKGLSTCCHGEEPHVVGWRFVGERRAIDLNADCGWARGKADVLYVADAFEVMAKVNALLAERRGG